MSKITDKEGRFLIAVMAARAPDGWATMASIAKAGYYDPTLPGVGPYRTASALARKGLLETSTAHGLNVYQLTTAGRFLAEDLAARKERS